MYVLLPPNSIDQPITSGMMRSIHNALGTRFKKPSPEVQAAMKSEGVVVTIEQWGKVQRVDTTVGGLIRAADSGVQGEDSRDASWVRVSVLTVNQVYGTDCENQYEVLVDKNTRNSKPPEFHQVTRYGQLQRLFRIQFETPCPALGLNETETILLAAIRSCKLDPEDALLKHLDIHFYSATGELDIVDLKCVECLVGRVPLGTSSWAVFDRSGDLVRSTWVSED